MASETERETMSTPLIIHKSRGPRNSTEFTGDCGKKNATQERREEEGLLNFPRPTSSTTRPIRPSSAWRGPRRTTRRQVFTTTTMMNSILVKARRTTKNGYRDVDDDDDDGEEEVEAGGGSGVMEWISSGGTTEPRCRSHERTGLEANNK